MINWTNKSQILRKFNKMQNTHIFEKNAFEDVVCEKSAMIIRPQFVD